MDTIGDAFASKRDTNVASSFGYRASEYRLRKGASISLAEEDRRGPSCV